MYEFALAVLITMTAAAVRAVSGGRRAATVLLIASIVWPFVNHPIEGPVLWVLSPGHGLTLSDLLAVVGVLIALWTLAGRPGAPRPERVRTVDFSEHR